MSGPPIPGEFNPPATDMEVALWRQGVSNQLKALTAAVEGYCEKTNHTLEGHSQRLDTFELALARQEGLRKEQDRLREQVDGLRAENRIANIVLAIGAAVAGILGIRN